MPILRIFQTKGSRAGYGRPSIGKLVKPVAGEPLTFRLPRLDVLLTVILRPFYQNALSEIHQFTGPPHSRRGKKRTLTETNKMITSASVQGPAPPQSTSSLER